MRVISGSARGRTLKGPPSTQTRPMADKVKGALFNSLASLGVEPERVLDLYAGTGSVGIEALSRGATHVDFVDQGREQCATIRTNLEVTKFSHQAAVHQVQVGTFIAGARTTYDFVILDPPYSEPTILKTLDDLGQSTLVQSGSIVVIGHWPRLELPERLGTLERLRNKCLGDSCYSIYEVVEPDPSHAGPEPGEDSVTA